MALGDWLLVVGLPLLVLLVVLEGRRQGRKYGKGRGTRLVGTGVLELQNLLEPERKVEVLREVERKRDLLVDIADLGEGKKPGGES